MLEDKMNLEKLNAVAEAMVADNKGLLAADESTGTIAKRLASINVESNEDNRRDYRELLRVNDAGQRKALSSQAAAQSWTRKQLRSAIRKIKTAKGLTPEKLPVEKLKVLKPGTVGLYRVRRYNNILYRDLGFSVYQRLTKQKGRAANPPEALLYTYEARVTRVVDGDTYYCLIDLGFDLVLEQRVRLRRLNAPEIITAEGQQAKQVLARVLKRAKGEILVKVSKTDDQYGRYLVDTWVKGKNIDADLLAAGVFHARG